MAAFTLRSKTDFIAVHCSATPAKQDIGAAEIDRWHREKGWLSIGYHFVIRRDGRIEMGRPVDRVGAHVEGYNWCSVGICMVGGVAADGKTPENNFTLTQFNQLAFLLRELQKKYPEAVIQGHRDFPNVAKACPSFPVAEWLKTQPELYQPVPKGTTK
jgi:N-acetylmuramoyl-L-alanine amidase